MYRYLLLFAHESTDIHQINKKKFFNTLQSNLKQLPSNIFKFKQFEGKTFDEIMKFKDEKEKEAFNKFPKLTNKTINNMFVYIKNLIEYLERNDYIKTNNMKIKYLEEVQILNSFPEVWKWSLTNLTWFLKVLNQNATIKLHFQLTSLALRLTHDASST